MVTTILNEYLTVIVFFLPFVIGLSFLFFPINEVKSKKYAIASMALYLLVVILLFGAKHLNGLAISSFVVSSFPGLKINYILDGVGGVFVVANSILYLVVLCLDLKNTRKGHRIYYSCLFVSLWSINAALSANDFFGYYIFSEITILPLLIIQILLNQGKIKKLFRSASIYIPLSSAAMVTALIYINSLGPVGGNNFLTSDVIRSLAIPFSGIFSSQAVVFFLLVFSIFIKIGFFPFHVWRVEMQEIAPLALNVIVSGSILFVGVYGLINFVLPSFPDVVKEYKNIVIAIAVFGMIYSVASAVRQVDPKKMVGYHSTIYISLIVIGLLMTTIDSVAGAVFLAVSSGLTTTLLILVIHYYFENRNKQMSVGVKTLLFVIIFSSLAFPLSSTFVGVFYIFSELFKVVTLLGIMAIIALSVQPFYLLKFYYSLIEQESSFSENQVNNKLSMVQLLPFYFLVGLVVCGGVWPNKIIEIYREFISTSL